MTSNPKVAEKGKSFDVVVVVAPKNDLRFNKNA